MSKYLAFGNRLTLPMLAVILVAFFFGLLIPIYVGIAGDGILRLLMLPALLLLFFLLVTSRIHLLYSIIVLRASLDNLFNEGKISLGSIQIGIGGLINLFVILIALLLVVEKPGLIPKKLIKAWLALLGVAFVGVVISPSQVEAFRLYLGMLSNFAIFVGAFYLVRTPEDYKKSIGAILLAALIPTFYGLYQLMTGDLYVTADAGLRLRSTFSHPNIFAYFLTLVISLILYTLKSVSFSLSVSKLLALIAYMLLIFVLLLATKSRTAWIACLSMFIMYGLLFERRYLLYLFLLGCIAFLIPEVRDRVLDLGAGNEVAQGTRINSFAWRLFLWESGLKWMSPSHYLLGYGLFSFKEYAIIFFPYDNRNVGAHSAYVQLLFELGVAGLLAFICIFLMLVSNLRMLIRSDRLGAFVLLMLVLEYLTISFSDNLLDYLSFNWYFWFVMGSGCAAVAASRTSLLVTPQVTHLTGAENKNVLQPSLRVSPAAFK